MNVILVIIGIITVAVYHKDIIEYFKDLLKDVKGVKK